LFTILNEKRLVKFMSMNYRGIINRRMSRQILIVAITCIIAGSAFAKELEAASIDVFRLLMGLFGGLSLFLFGIDQMSQGLKAVAGDRMASLLGGMTRNRFMGAITGAFVTAILNSSSVTTVLVVGFITAGIMSLSQSIGVIMGANVGSTMTAQIVAFNVTQYAMLPIAIGFGMIFFGKTEKMKHGGAMLFGLGLLFGGMGVMSEAMYPLRSYPPFLELMGQLETPILGILAGALFTGLVQSSAATTGIAIVMASEGLMSLPAGIALALGANIGTCVTALLASMGKPVAAKQAAAAHIVFNVIGVLIWWPFIDLLAQLSASVSPAYPELDGAARMAKEVPRQIANAHTIFNVANTLIFIWFTGLLARLVQRMIPEREVAELEIISPKYLSEELLDTPTLALDACRMEGGRLGSIVENMVEQVGPALRARDMQQLDELEKMDDQVGVLQEHILDYLGDIHKRELTEKQGRRLFLMIKGLDEIQRIASTVRSDLVPLGRTAHEKAMEATDTTRHIFTKLYERVCDAVRQSKAAIKDLDQNKALEIINMKTEIDSLINEALEYQAERVAPTTPDLIATFRMEDEVIDALRRIYRLTRRLAKLLLPAVVSSKET
jgi:phosphate:Na+ symporter